MATGCGLPSFCNTGPLAGVAFNPQLLQVFVSVVGITALALAATIDERRQATHDLKKLQDELELLVQRRTAELNLAVTALENDVAAREKIQNALLAKEIQLEEAQHLAHMGSWEWDAASNRMIMSNEMLRIYGISPDKQASLTYKDYLTYIPAEECHLVDEVVQGALTTKQPFSYGQTGTGAYRNHVDEKRRAADGYAAPVEASRRAFVCR